MKRTLKKERYEDAVKKTLSLVDGLTDEIAVMASMASVLKNSFDYYFWVGFYRRYNENELIIGPYQGTPGCLYIPFGKGVCGKCAASEESIIVDNVHEFDGHIACDSRSNSEIVVPVFNKSNQLMAVLDVDSTEFAAFDETDQKYLEQLLEFFKKNIS